jgi:hypothetical protein
MTSRTTSTGRDLPRRRHPPAIPPPLRSGPSWPICATKGDCPTWSRRCQSLSCSAQPRSLGRQPQAAPSDDYPLSGGLFTFGGDTLGPLLSGGSTSALWNL